MSKWYTVVILVFAAWMCTTYINAFEVELKKFFWAGTASWRCLRPLTEVLRECIQTRKCVHICKKFDGGIKI